MENLIQVCLDRLTKEEYEYVRRYIESRERLLTAAKATRAEGAATHLTTYDDLDAAIDACEGEAKS